MHFYLLWSILHILHTSTTYYNYILQLHTTTTYYNYILQLHTSTSYFNCILQLHTSTTPNEPTLKLSYSYVIYPFNNTKKNLHVILQSSEPCFAKANRIIVNSYLLKEKRELVWDLLDSDTKKCKDIAFSVVYIHLWLSTKACIIHWQVNFLS